MLENYKNKKVAILGLGVEGIATAEFLLKHQISFSVLDMKSEQELQEIYPEVVARLQKQHVLFIGGAGYLLHLEKFDIIVRSPGISILTPELSAAKQKGIEITSHTKLFFDLCPCPIIGITGTKGKGTTSTLIYKMLEESGKKAYLGGNIGRPPLTFLDSLTNDSYAVLELSSFQLQDATKSPHIAVTLMITSEHLDYHATTEEYVDAKRNILRFQTSHDLAVINIDYPASNESDIHTNAQIYVVSREREVAEQGCFIKENAVLIRREGRDKKIIGTSEIALLGKHNWENVCAAVMAASLAGATEEAMVSVLKMFTGLEHRLERVAEINNVTYYDDSFSTTPETTIAAIESFEQPEILILGGSSKGSDFHELGQVVGRTRNIKAIIGIGEEWMEIKSKIKNQISKIQFVEGAKSMKEIILEASEIAESGDVVLLSPGCASFDMFKNYKDRGEQFKKEVQGLLSNS